jgi:hypothetical protein
VRIAREKAHGNPCRLWRFSIPGNAGSIDGAAPRCPSHFALKRNGQRAPKGSRHVY